MADVHEVMYSSAWMPVSDENILDYDLGNRQQQTEAWIRLERRRWAADRYWRSLPWHVRLYRTAKAWLR